MFCCPRCSQLSTILTNIVTPGSGSAILFNIVDKCEQRAQQTLFDPVKQQAQRFYACMKLFVLMRLEKGDVKVKTEALKRVIYQIINGDKMPGLLMVIIRFVLPSHNHMIKKLLLIFWEIVPKLGPDGKLLQEMILVCDAYRKVKWFKTFLAILINPRRHKNLDFLAF
jgi:coatomer subunit beta